MDHPTIDDVAAVLALAPRSQPWKLEGPARHRLRVILLQARWTRSWHRADLEARRLVANGRLKNGVGMATGWDDNDLSSWTEVDECPICGRIFIPSKGRVRRIYCSDRCTWRASYIRRKLGEAPHRNTRCARCNDVLIDPQPHQKFCSKHCANMAADDRAKFMAGGDERHCQECGKHLPFETPMDAKFCGPVCRHRSWRKHSEAYQAGREARAALRREKRRLAKLNGHAATTNGHANGSTTPANGHAPDDRPEPAGAAPGDADDQAAVADRRERASGADARAAAR